MKTLFHFRLMLFAVVFTAVTANISIAQNNNQQLGPLWDKDQPSKNIFENLNYNNVGIGTAVPEEKLHVKGNLKVEGKIISDTVLHFSNNVTIDSSLEVKGETVGFTNGEGSFWWKPNFTTPILQDLVSVSTGYFTVMGGGKKSIIPLIGMGINTQTPKAILHINDANTTYLQITNNATGMASTADGFRVGLDATGNAEIHQLENLPLNFFTSNLQRATILANGNTGIGTTAPTSLLHIESPGTTNSTSSLLVRSAVSGGRRLFQIFDDGTIEINQPNSISAQLNLFSELNYGTYLTVNSNSNSHVIGLFGLSTNTGTGNAIGVRGSAYFSSSNNSLVSIGMMGFSAKAGLPAAAGIGVYGTSLTFSLQPSTSMGVVGNGLDGTTFNLGGAFNGVGFGFTNYPAYSRGIQAIAGDGNIDNVGVVALTWNMNQNFPSTGTDYGIYANIFNPNTVSNQFWSAFVNGPGYITQLWTISDTAFKQNIDTIANAMNIISQLKPHKYEFKSEQYPDMNLPTGIQFGFTAQEIENVLPNLVKDVRKPEDLDSLGNVVNPARTFKGYTETSLIPIIVQAVKEVDSTLTKATSVPDAPVLISPADGEADNFNKGQLTWHSVSAGVVLYRAQIAKDNSFSNVVFDQSGITDTTTRFGGVCDTIPATFYWRVNAKNNTGTGAWSAVFSFVNTATCTPIGPAPIGTQTGVGFNSASDSHLKTNVASITDALDKVSQLNGVSYDWVPTSGYEFDSTQQIGFIAQDVQTVVPQVVHTDANGNLTLDYGRLVPVLVEAIKDLKAQVNTLQGGGSKTTVNNNPPSTDAELASENSILFQNFPNPFGDGTIIRYFVTEKSASANMLFYDEFGNKIKTIELPHKGQNAELNLSTANLASGIYSYSLVVDGKIIATKNMVKTK